MGEARRRSQTRGVIDGGMRIVRYAPGSIKRPGADPAARRVEYHLDRMTMREAYDAICAVKRAFEETFARAAVQAAEADAAKAAAEEAEGRDEAAP